MTCITTLEVIDVRFPTSRGLDGSDAMNPEPDYSAAYVVLRTSDSDIAGYSLLFTTGRGNDVACAAVRALAPYIVGRDVAELAADVGVVFDAAVRGLTPALRCRHGLLLALVRRHCQVWNPASAIKTTNRSRKRVCRRCWRDRAARA